MLLVFFDNLIMALKVLLRAPQYQAHRSLICMSSLCSIYKTTQFLNARSLLLRCRQVKAYWLHSKHRITNKAAIQSLDSILTGKSFSNYQQPRHAVQAAIDLFHEIEDVKTHSTVNVLMKVFVHFNEPQRVFPLWKEVVSTPNISYPLLVRCCVHCNPPHFSMDKCIESLSRMQAMNYKVSKHDRAAHSKTVSKLITHRCTEYKQLQSVQTVTWYNSDIFNKNALIGAYGKVKHRHGLDSAVATFHSIPPDQRTTVTLNAMMTVYVNHSLFSEGIALYEAHHNAMDEISHKLALRACIGMHDLTKGRVIADAVRHRDHPPLQSSLIAFYGHCGDIEAAENVFHSVSEHKRTVVHIGAMMKALIDTKRYQRALALYAEHGAMTNDVTHLLALKACRALNDYQRGVAVHRTVEQRLKRTRGLRPSVELTNTLSLVLYDSINPLTHPLSLLLVPQSIFMDISRSLPLSDSSLDPLHSIHPQ